MSIEKGIVGIDFARPGVGAGCKYEVLVYLYISRV